MNDTNKKLLMECMMFEPDGALLHESIANPNKPFRVKGIVQRKGVKNQNGRIYPSGVLEKSIQTYIDTFVKDRRALGECDHPDSEIVNLKNVSHNIIDLTWQGDDLIGTLEILTTPSGNILRELFKCGIKVGISSRATGSVKKISESTVIVNDDLMMVAFDAVSNPSTQGAFLHQSDQIALSEGIVKNPITNQWTRTDELIHNILSELN